MRNRLSLIILILFSAISSNAQLCSGALGDPIVSIDFGSGTGRGAALGSAITAYTYVSSGQLGEGQYTIANSTTGLKGSAWLTISDHTGNANGYMMVINSATLASEGVFYKKQVDDLCPNTTYEFSAWMINVMTSVSPNPNVTFKIRKTDGTLIQQYDSGELALNGGWKKSGFYFTTGAESSVVISVSNNAPSAVPGNDLALDDIQFRACGPVITSAVNSSGQSSATICAGSTALISLSAAVSAGYATPQYQWQLSTDGQTWTDIAGATSTATNVNFTNAVAGTYRYRLAVGEAANFGSVNCRVISPVLTITVNALPIVTVSANASLCVGETLNLTASGGNTYQWTGPNGFTSTQQNPVITNVQESQTGTYQVTASSVSGCTSTKQTTVAIGTRPTVSISPAVTICQGEGTPLTATGGVSYNWTPVTGLSDSHSASPVARPDQTTTYTVTVADQTSACPTTATVTVTVLPNTFADAGPDKTILAGNAVRLEGKVSGANAIYAWTPSTGLDDAASLTPNANPAQTTVYTLTSKSQNNCGVSTDQVTVTVLDQLVIPNTFSPNGDGVNDTWNLTGLNSYVQATVQVYNRYGSQVFYSVGYSRPWDGNMNSSPLPVGTYYYLIDRKQGFEKLSGWVVILR